MCDKYILKKIYQLINLRKIFIILIMSTLLIFFIINFNLIFLLILILIQSFILGYIYITEENKLISKFSIYLLEKFKTDDIMEVVFFIRSKKICELENNLNIDTIKKICECINNNN